MRSGLYRKKNSKKNFFINDVIRKLKNKSNVLKFSNVCTYRDYISIHDINTALYKMINLKLKNDYNFLIQKLDTENDLMRSLSFNLIGKVSNSVIIFYNVDANKFNIICNVSKSLPENSKIDASHIINKICEEIGGAGGGQRYYASGSGPKNDKIETIIKTVTKNLL